MMKKSVSLTFALVAAAFVSLADVNNYTGTNNGYWNVGSNWSLGHEPTAEEDVTLAKNVTVYATTSVAAKSISVSTGTLDIKNSSNLADFSVNISGNVTLSGTGKMYVRAGRTDGIDATDWQASAALLWANRNMVNIGGKLTVGSGATLYSANHQETGTPVVFNCAELEVEAGGTISTKQLGHNWLSCTELPAGAVNPSGKTGYYTYAFGAGNAYNHAAGYGGAGNDASYGKPYGYRFAPFFAGSQAGIHSGLPTTAPGSIVLMVSGKATITGTITAAADNNTYGGNSGGGIWICAATADIADTALVTVEGGTCTNYGGVYGGGGRLALCFGLTSDDIARMAAGGEPEELTAIEPYGFKWTAVGGKDNSASDSKRGKSGTAYLIYRAETVALRSVSGVPANLGSVEPRYGLHAYPAGEIPTFTAPDAIYPDGYRTQRRFGTVAQSTAEGDQPGVAWNFSDEQYLLRVQLNGTGTVSAGGETRTASFEQWVDIGESVTLAASGDFAMWTGDFAGGVTNVSTLVLEMDSPRLVQATFVDATGVARSYSGEAGGFWDVAENWTPEGVPTPLDDVTVPAGAFARGVNTLAAKSLTVAGYLALGGETKDATTAQKLTDLLAGWYGLVLTGDLAVSGGLTLGSRTQTCILTDVAIGGNVTLSSSGKLAVYAPEQTDVITSPYAEFYANRMIVSIGGNLAVGDTAVLYPVGDRRTGTPIEWTVGGDFSLASGAKVTAENLGFNWVAQSDSRATRSAGEAGITYYTLSPGSPSSGYTASGCYGGGSLAYGFAAAPFLPGAPSSIYGNFDAGGGVVWVNAKGQMNLAGKINADGTRSGSYSGGAGGSIWLLAKKIVAEDTASLSAIGGRQSHGSALDGAGTGGRIALGIGLTDADIAALAAGTEPAEIEGLTLSEEITLLTVNVRGGEYNKKGSGNVTVYGASGTAVTVTGAAADTIVTVYGLPIEPTGENGPVYGPTQCPQGETATFTSEAVASLAGEAETVRYTVQGWVVSNATAEVARGMGTTATFTPGKEPLALYWLWGGRETQSAAVANNAEFGSVLVDGAASETGAKWTRETDEVTFTAVPADAEHEFLCWIGDVPFGQTRSNPLTVVAGEPRRLTAFFRTNEVACTRTWIGKASTRGEWYDPAKWSPAGVPGPDDDVIINQGTVDATNCLVVGSLTIGGAGIVWVGANAAANNVNQDINLYMTSYTSKSKLEEAYVSVARDLTMTGKGQLAVGAGIRQKYHATLTVGGDFSMSGTNKLQIVAGPIEKDFTLQTGAGWVTVGGKLTVGGKSIVYPKCEAYTGGTVVFRAHEAVVESNATIYAVASGYYYNGDLSPAHHAPGVGTDYTVGGGYGGYGLRDTKFYAYDQTQPGKTYGYAYAPIHAGSPLGGWGGATIDQGGGLIRIHADRVRIDGTLNARAAELDVTTANSQAGGSGSGGGIWVTCAGTPEIGSTARLLAKGGCRATPAGSAGGGGRIAIAAHVTDAQVAELAETGTVAAWKPGGRHFQNQAEFEGKFPGVTINLEPGEQPAAEYLEFTRGTFWYLEAVNPALTIILR